MKTCTASAVSLYFTASETSIGWSDMVIGDHVWENCNPTNIISIGTPIEVVAEN